MSLAVVRSRALLGLHAPEVRVEVHLGNGLPAFHIVGLPQAAVRESADRVRAALLHGGFDFPNRRLTVNLAPADLPKDSGRFDLPIAVGILAASGQVPADGLQDLEFVGELSLTGEIRPIRGALAMVLAVVDADRRRRLVIPAACRAEAALVPEPHTLAAATLAEVGAHLRGQSCLERVAHEPPPAHPRPAPDLGDVRGQLWARRALEVAAAGGHSILMVGPPGTGKSMLAVRLPGLLPPMDDAHARESAAVLSVAGRFDAAHWGVRPFRSPHHTVSAVALVGGGSPPRPGEVSLAHGGVLFLDELTEFRRAALESLREPIERGQVTVSRGARTADFPASFQLVAAMNPCPCGHLGHPRIACRCRPDAIARYRARVSGPLLDRIDLVVPVPVPTDEDLTGDAGSESTEIVAARVARARDRALARQGTPNAQLPAAQLLACGRVAPAAFGLLRAASARLGLSARGFHRVLRIARTVADLAHADTVVEMHVAEAVQWRRGLPRDGTSDDPTAI